MAWANILGHDRWIDAFRAVKARGRLAHAYLFVGSEGVGKRLFAIELAKTMLCENPPESPTLTACDQCPACLLVDAGTHPDLFQIRKPDDANVLDIDTVRELCASFGLKAARGRGKVAIVDDADDLNEQAANSFLKTLEEPPPGSIIILIGTSLELQLQTIRSRCQPIRFAPLPSPLVRQILEGDPEIDRGLIPRLVRLGQGSPGQARQLADPALWEFLNRLLPAIARPRFNSVELGKEFAKFAEDAGKETSLHRARARLVMKLLLASIRDAIRLRLGEAPPAELVDEAKLLEALAARAAPDKWLAVVERCLESEVQLDRYIPVGLVLVGLMDALGQLLDRSGS